MTPTRDFEYEKRKEEAKQLIAAGGCAAIKFWSFTDAQLLCPDTHKPEVKFEPLEGTVYISEWLDEAKKAVALINRGIALLETKTPKPKAAAPGEPVEANQPAGGGWIKVSDHLPLQKAHWITGKYGQHDNDFPVRMNGRYSMANIFDEALKGDSQPRFSIKFEGRHHFENEFSEIEWLDNSETSATPLPSDKPVEGVKDVPDIHVGDITVPAVFERWAVRRSEERPDIEKFDQWADDTVEGYQLGRYHGALDAFNHLQPKDLNVPYWVAQVQNQREKVAALASQLATANETIATLRSSFQSSDHQWKQMLDEAKAERDLLLKGMRQAALELNHDDKKRSFEIMCEALNKFTNNKDNNHE